MHKLKPITPLGGLAAHVDQIGTLTIIEVVDQALASLAARSGQREALENALPLRLPDVGKSAVDGDFTVFWTGPDQWMVSAPYDAHELLAAELKQMVGATASVAEQTDGWCRFDVSGAALCDLFERLSNVPLRTMQPGEIKRGMIEHLGAFLWRITDDRAAVLAPRSAAASLHHALLAAARSIA